MLNLFVAMPRSVCPADLGALFNSKRDRLITFRLQQESVTHGVQVNACSRNSTLRGILYFNKRLVLTVTDVSWRV